MVKTYKYTDARRQTLKKFLAEAEKDGEIRIIQRDGKVFVLRLLRLGNSPLDVSGVDTSVTRQDVIDSVRAGREQDEYERRASYTSG
jgi:hypothetical protein